MDVSVIIVTYNTFDLTKSCIDSIFEKTKDISFEVILVDNASSDGSKEYFRSDSRIKYIYSDENLGFGRANNLGYEVCNGRYVFFLNSDTLLLNNAIKEFVVFMDNSEASVGYCGTVLLDKNYKPMHSFGKFQSVRYFTHRIMRFYWSKLCKPMNIPKDTDVYPKQVDYITGADLFVKKEVIEKCGLFDPEFFMYYEEAEMQFRYRSSGIYGVVIDSPLIMHLAGASSYTTVRSLRKDIMELKSRYVYLEKTHTGMKKKLICVMHLLMIPRIWIKRVDPKEKSTMTKLILSNI